METQSSRDVLPAIHDQIILGSSPTLTTAEGNVFNIPDELLSAQSKVSVVCEYLVRNNLMERLFILQETNPSHKIFLEPLILGAMNRYDSERVIANIEKVPHL